MNIDDAVSNDDVGTGELVSAIIKKQKVLMERYDEIERKNGVSVPHAPYNLHSRVVQLRIKDMFWRTTEELMEALECECPLIGDWKFQWDKDVGIRHFFEELADGLHFLAEATIISGTDVRVLDGQWNYEEEFESPQHSWVAAERRVHRIVYQMGLTANKLKNKPWKTSEMMTDLLAYDKCVQNTWHAFAQVFIHLDCSQQFVFDMYCRKNLVNQFRQRSNY